MLDQLTRLFWRGTTDEAKLWRAHYLERCSTQSLINRAVRLDESALRILEGVSGCFFTTRSVCWLLLTMALSFSLTT